MDRRRFIAATGGLVLGTQAPRVLGEFTSPEPDYSCHSTHRLTQGPYLVPDSPRRSDIREGVVGTPLRLSLKVISAIYCTPLEDCIVDVWHCDALGLYSGVQNIVFDEATLRQTDRTPVDLRDKTYLRGHQVTDADGRVEFTTIFPGWYLPRIAHLHVRTISHGIASTAMDTQLYLPADAERSVYQTEPYRSRGPNPIDIARDIVMKGDVAATRSLTIPLEKDGDGFRGEYTIAAPG